MLIALMIVAGLVALYFGAEWLIRGSASLAVRLGVTPLLVGLTVVAYGTSTPELVVSCLAAAHGHTAIALGNAVGSNIINICVILGLTALCCPLRVQFQLIRVDTPIMIGVALLFLVLFLDRRIERWEAMVFLAGIAGYTLLQIRLARRHALPVFEAEFQEGLPPPTRSLVMDLLLILGGLGVLVLGSRLFVSGSVQLARWFGVSDALIGLTIIAAGTSLPELAACLMAAFRKQPDIAIGNVVGSNIYNILAILGVSGLVRSPLEGGGVGLLDAGVMVGVSFLLLLIAWTGFKLRRGEGVLLLAVYGVYLWHLWPD